MFGSKGSGSSGGAQRDGAGGGGAAARAERLATFAAASAAELAGRVAAGEAGGAGPCRLALLDPSEQRRELARKVVERGLRWTGRHDVWFAPSGLAGEGGRMVFLYPGFDAVFEPRIEDVSEHFGIEAPAVGGATALEGRAREVVRVGRFLDEAIRRLGLVPDAVAGHSIGEWTGMIAAGLVPADRLAEFIGSLSARDFQVADVEFGVIGFPVERVEEAIAGISELYISHDNCPRQTIICGHAKDVEPVLEKLRRAGALCQRLPFRSGFHSPLFSGFVSGLREAIERVPIGRAWVPMWSATTCSPYPSDPAAVRELMVEHLLRPVRFRPLIERLYAEGFRLFVQVGAGSLPGFVHDTLGDRPHLTISANVPRHTGLGQLQRVAAALWVEGVPVRFEALPWAEGSELPREPAEDVGRAAGDDAGLGGRERRRAAAGGRRGAAGGGGPA